DGCVGFARGVEQRVDVERNAPSPAGERRRRDEAIQLHRQSEAVLLREERVEIDDAELAQRGLLYLRDQRSQIEIGAHVPCVGNKVGQQDVFAAREWIAVDVDEIEEARHETIDLVLQRL